MKTRLPIWLVKASRPIASRRLGRLVSLLGVSNVSRGGDTVDVTDQIHPSIRDVAERAAALLELDPCGVDFLTTDIARPYEETGGAICEVNNMPGFSLHEVVSEGTPRDVVSPYLETLYLSGTPTRIPVVGIARPSARRLDQESDLSCRRTRGASGRCCLSPLEQNIIANRATTLSSCCSAGLVKSPRLDTGPRLGVAGDIPARMSRGRALVWMPSIWSCCLSRRNCGRKPASTPSLPLLAAKPSLTASQTSKQPCSLLSDLKVSARLRRSPR